MTAPDPHAVSSLRRAVYVVIGSMAALLGFVGVFLPLLPTTPFLLLAGYCFARSSRTLHHRLLETRAFGPYLKQWQRDHSVPAAAKRRAYLAIAVSFGLSIWLVDRPALRALLVVLGVTITWVVWRLPTTVEPDFEQDP